MKASTALNDVHLPSQDGGDFASTKSTTNTRFSWKKLFGRKPQDQPPVREQDSSREQIVTSPATVEQTQEAITETSEAPVDQAFLEPEPSKPEVTSEPVSHEDVASPSSNETAACDQGATMVRIAASLCQKEATAALLARGSDVMARDHEGRTALHRAVLCGSAGVAELLLNHGADVNARNAFGITPLRTAAIFGLKEVAELLIARGADVNAADNFGDTPLRSALDRNQKEIANLLRHHGAVESTPREVAPPVMFKSTEVVELTCETESDAKGATVGEERNRDASASALAA